MAEETGWRNRIIGSGTKPADQFTHHPNNPKYHPPEQREALQGALNEIGWLSPVIENVQTGYLIDGHERVWGALQNNEDVPYIQVSLSPEEEAYALATLDPIGMMARHDAAKLDELLRKVNSGEAGVQAMLSKLAEGVSIPSGDSWGDAFGGVPEGDRSPFQQMTFTLHDSQVDKVKQALDLAFAEGAFIGSPNANSNGNALARVCEMVITYHERERHYSETD